MSKLVTKEEFIKRSNKIHNNKYDYSNVKFNTIQDYITIICPIHGEFIQRASNHLYNDDGCPSCSGNKRLTTQEFISRAREVHGNKYNYDKVEYKNSENKVEIICPIHGSFWQSYRHHILRGHGCPDCNGGILQTSEDFIKKAISTHGNKYNYSKVNYINAITPVEIICSVHGSFWQTPHTHITGKGGCPKCAGKGSSKLEEETKQYLDFYNIVYEEQYTWNWLKYDRFQHVDFYLPEYNSAIECQGLQHFIEIDHFGEFQEIMNRDINKEKLCLEHGIAIYYFSNIKKTYRLDFKYPYQVYDDLNELIKYIKKPTIFI